MTKKISFVLLFLLLCSANLFAQRQPKISKSDDFYPSGFNPRKSTLLIAKLKSNPKTQKILEDYVAKNYPYKYEFAETEEIIDTAGKYTDLKTYKFALMGIHRGWNALIETGKPVNCFQFLDRFLNERYPPSKILPEAVIPVFQIIIRKLVSDY